MIQTPSKEQIMLEKAKLYNFGRELGSGTFSTVYEATRVDNGERYAIKVFPKSNLRSREDEERFQREADAMAYLQYDNLVAMHDFFGIMRIFIWWLTTAKAGNYLTT